jgi:hypothetical protein
MRALAFIIGGFFVFFLLLLTTQRSDKRALARVSANFVGLWFVVAAGNLYYSVTYAGGSLTDELPFAVLIFLPPAIPAAVIWFRNRAASPSTDRR